MGIHLVVIFETYKDTVDIQGCIFWAEWLTGQSARQDSLPNGNQPKGRKEADRPPMDSS